MIAAVMGDDESMFVVKNLYSLGHVMKDEFEVTLRKHHAWKEEIKSEQRKEAKEAKMNYLVPTSKLLEKCHWEGSL